MADEKKQPTEKQLAARAKSAERLRQMAIDKKNASPGDGGEAKKEAASELVDIVDLLAADIEAYSKGKERSNVAYQELSKLKSKFDVKTILEGLSETETATLRKALNNNPWTHQHLAPVLEKHNINL